MSNYLTTDTDLVAVADAIRAKSGGSSSLTFPSGFVSEIQSIPTGGGGGVAPNDVNFLDYDGTIVAAYSAADFANLSALPSNPSHTGLTAQGWNWTLADAKTYVAAYGKCDIGQMYITDDGKTRLYITIAAPGRMTVPLYWSQTVANGVTIDWGDGSATETFAGTGNKNTTHTYEAVGDYIITLNPAEGCTLGLGNGSTSYTVLGGGLNGRVYQNMLQKVEIGAGVTSIRDYAFDDCYSLASIVIPQSVTTFGTQAFYNCYSLASIVIPKGVTSIRDYAFTNCHSLASIVIPQGVTTFGTQAFSNCYSLLNAIIPQGVTTIGNQAFYNCYSLSFAIIPQGVTTIGSSVFYDCYSLASIVIQQVGTFVSGLLGSCYSLASIVIPQGVTTIGAQTFNGCSGMALYDFTACTSVPTLSNSNAFSSIPADCVILVPASLYNTWKAATNWATYASHIQPDGPTGYEVVLTNDSSVCPDLTAANDSGVEYSTDGGTTWTNLGAAYDDTTTVTLTGIAQLEVYGQDGVGVYDVFGWNGSSWENLGDLSLTQFLGTYSKFGVRIDS